MEDLKLSRFLYSSEFLEKVEILGITNRIASTLLGDLKFYDLEGEFDSETEDYLVDLVQRTEQFDGLISLLQMTQRSKDKLAGISKAKISDKSPLKTISFLKKSEALRDNLSSMGKTQIGYFIDRFYIARDRKRFVSDTSKKDDGQTTGTPKKVL